MEFTYQNRVIHTFAITPRTLELGEYWKQIDQVGQRCADYGFTGPLLFNGNDTFVEVFVCAQTMVEKYGLAPLIAVNPEYMHPFTVAKFVSSYAYAFDQKVYLNMITGTALSQAKAMHCELNHDQKYGRLREYIEIVQLLTRQTERTVSFEGDYYGISDLKISTPIPDSLLPGYFIAGHSDAAAAVRDRTGAIGMKMLDPGLAESISSDRGVHFGVVCRDTTEAAWEAANERFPEDQRGQRLLKHSMKNTESAWKKRLMFAAESEDLGE
ncbi:MAG: LLM class flavin-dependent oxidoreductase, partial [Verrucomicrobiota bacterium]